MGIKQLPNYPLCNSPYRSAKCALSDQLLNSRRYRFGAHLISLMRIDDGDLMRKYVYNTLLYSGAFDSLCKQGRTQIDKGIDDIEAGIKRIEKDSRCTGHLTKCVTYARSICWILNPHNSRIGRVADILLSYEPL